MRWTPEAIAELRHMAAAGYTMREAAANLGVSLGTVKTCANYRGIRFHGWHKAESYRDDDAIRERWAVLIGPMKQALRDEIEAAP